MIDKNYNQELVRARELANKWQLVEAYHILRLFFGRLPFQAEPEHAEYIGLFVRILLELGKNRELSFYQSALERQIQLNPNSYELKYQLGRVYLANNTDKLSEATHLFWNIVKCCPDKNLVVKARLLLAQSIDNSGGRVSEWGEIISVIKETDNRDLNLSIEIWKLKLLRDQKKLTEARPRLEALISSLTLPDDWYHYFSASVILARLYLLQTEIDACEKICFKIRSAIHGKRFRSVEIQIQDLLSELGAYNKTWILECRDNSKTYLQLIRGKKQVRLKSNGVKAILLRQLIKQGKLDYSDIAKAINHTSEKASANSTRIHNNISSLTRIFERLGRHQDIFITGTHGIRFNKNIQIDYACA